MGEAVSMQLNQILTAALTRDASDIHLVPGHAPIARIHTALEPMEYPTISTEWAHRTLEQMVSHDQFATFSETHDLDFSYVMGGTQRFRVNAHRQKGGVALAFRSIRSEIPELESLNLPTVIETLTRLPRGLVLVTGATGSGKSTTLAAMLQAINVRDSKHVITLEDPIEYLFESEACLFEQRERGVDMESFSSGLKHALRQDPDIILVGEMRDLETTSLAISAAETGHLVFSTLHTNSAAQSVDRIIDMYPAEQQNQVRSMLANTLQAVVTQSLFPRRDAPGMVPATEVLICTPAVRNIIREARTFEIPNVIETNRSLGMTSLDHSIASLVFNGFISREDALAHAINPDRLDQAFAA